MEWWFMKGNDVLSVLDLGKTKAGANQFVLLIFTIHFDLKVKNYSYHSHTKLSFSLKK